MFSDTVTMTALTIPQVGDDILNASQFKYHCFEIHITALTTNVVMRMEGSISGAGYGNLASDGLNTTYTASGIYFLFNTQPRIVNAARLNWISGAATSIQVYYKGGN